MTSVVHSEDGGRSGRMRAGIPAEAQVAADLRSKAAALREERLFAEQWSAIHPGLRRALVGCLVSAAFTTFVFWQSWGGLLLAWSGAIAAICLARLLGQRWLDRMPAFDRAAAERWSVGFSLVSGVVVASAPMWIACRSTGFPFSYMLALALGAFWCGTFVHAPLLKSAVAFMAAQFGVWVAVTLGVGLTWESGCLMALFGCGTGVALHVARQHSALFAQHVLQQIELESKTHDLQQQSDVVALLLKEHEEHSSDWLWQTDAAHRITNASLRFAEVFASEQSRLGGRDLSEILAWPDVQGNADALARLSTHVAGAQSFRDLSVPIRSADGGRQWLSLSGRPAFDETGAFSGYCGVMADITAAKIAEARVVHLASHDALTNLPNRAYFCERIDRALETPGSHPLAVVSIDLDGFKPVNDRHGHPTGDALLVAVADRLRGAVASRDLVARFGGDEFAVETRDCEPDEIETLCGRIVEALAAPFRIGGIEVTIGASIGVAIAPFDGQLTAELIKNADAALYRAKHDGRGTFRLFSPEMDRRLQERQSLIQDLRTAIGQGEICLHYQPFVDAGTGQVTGCEALIRWRHPSRGMVPPLHFVPLAEDSGLIVAIGAWVLEQACREAVTWPAGRRVAVNVSPVQFRDRRLPEQILAALHRTGLDPSRLEIEVTETVLVEDAEAALDILRRIQALGVRVALDDFGTGYSSLSYLRRFPFDKIKIDRSFVQELDRQCDSLIIVHAIRDIARGLGMTLTAEGVETSDQADQLRLTGCDELQGYLFSRPRPPADLPVLFGQQFFPSADVPDVRLRA